MTSKVVNIFDGSPYKSNEIVSPSEFLESLEDTWQVLSIIQIREMYSLLAAHERETFLSMVNKSRSISSNRKSFLYQVAHFEEHGIDEFSLSLYMMLALYWWMQSGVSLEIWRLVKKVLETDSIVQKNLVEETILANNEYLGQSPWQLSGNQRTQIKTLLLSQFNTGKMKEDDFKQ